MTQQRKKGPKPGWLKRPLPGGPGFSRVKKILKRLGLHTVCESAMCPNRGECWGYGTATFLILGNTCTRSCRFCAVPKGNPGGLVDWSEPVRVAEAAEAMGLSYVVVTSVDRDDLEDFGAGTFSMTTRLLKETSPLPGVELLIPDFQGSWESINSVLESKPDVLAHNLETVESLTPGIRDRRCSYKTSLRVLEYVKKANPSQITKSGVMVGLGEKREEVVEAMRHMKDAGVSILTIGQYLQPTRKHLPVARYVTPGEFREYEEEGKRMGFAFVASGPMVRSSYMAKQAFREAIKRTRAREGESPV